MMLDRAGILSISAGLAAVLLLTGCENTLDPVDEETGLFSIYGYLTVANGEHFVRIKDLNEPIIKDSMHTIDATVTLENLDTGTTETLTDSMVDYEGVTTHNFRSEQEIQPEATYQVTVERSDGRTSQASATMPGIPELDVEPAQDDTAYCAEEGLLLTFYNIPDQSRPRLSIGIFWRDEWHWVDRKAHTQYGFLPFRIVEEVVPPIALEPLNAPREYCMLLEYDKIRLAYTHFGPDWPADSLLTDPTASIVENGLGVFGGIYRDTLRRTVDTTGAEPTS